MKEYGQTNESETEETGWSIGWQERDERKVKTSDKKSRNVLESNLWVFRWDVESTRGVAVVSSAQSNLACPAYEKPVLVRYLLSPYRKGVGH